MRCAVINVVIFALAGFTLAAPLSGAAPARRANALAARDYPKFPGFGNTENTPYISYADDNGNASSGDADDADGGSVTNDAGADGSVDNEGASCEHNLHVLCSA